MNVDVIQGIHIKHKYRTAKKKKIIINDSLNRRIIKQGKRSY